MNNPVKLIDPDGMEVDGDYYDNKGNYITTDGIDDGKIYVMNSSSDKDFSSMSCDELKSNSTEVQLSTFENKKATFIKWAAKYKELGNRYSNDPKGDREFAMSLFTGTINTEEGQKEVFAQGSLAKGLKGVDGVSLLDSKSPIEGWSRAESIHTHRWGGSGNFSGGYSFLVGNDVSTAVETGHTLYLAVPYSDYIGSFDPKTYNKHIQNGKSPERAQRYSTNKEAIWIH